MRSLLLALLVLPLSARAQPPLPAETIMARVAANQDRSETERAHFVYTQHARVVSRKGQIVRCEEITDVRVTLTPTGSRQSLLRLSGRLLVKHRYVTYDKLPPHNAAYSQPPQERPTTA